MKAAAAPWSNDARTAALQHAGPSEDLHVQPDNRIDRLRQNHARTQKKLMSIKVKQASKGAIKEEEEE